MRNLIILATALLVCACCSAQSLSVQYDKQIKRAAAIHLPYIDWRLYKAQLYQESLLDPLAVSHAGAKGIAQFMPATWREYQAAYKTPALAFDPAHGIKAGAWYMWKMRRFWKSPRPEHDRHSLALTSYNQGAGRTHAAQKQCGNPLLYIDIAKCFQSKEAREYAPKIWRHYLAMLLGI